MFGFLYALFMGGACAVDSIKKDLEDSDAQNRSKQNGGQWAIGARKNYWNGVEAKWSGCDTPTSHYVIKDKNGRIIKDYTQEEYDEQERKDEQRFIDEMTKAREEGKYYFDWYTDIFYSNGDFKLNHPKGFYEVDTLKRFHIMTDEKGKHYKMYDKIKEEGVDSTGLFYRKVVEPDEDNKIEISEAEWRKLGGEKNEIYSMGKLRTGRDRRGVDYMFAVNSYKIDKKRGRR